MIIDLIPQLLPYIKVEDKKITAYKIPSILYFSKFYQQHAILRSRRNTGSYTLGWGRGYLPGKHNHEGNIGSIHSD